MPEIIFIRVVFPDPFSPSKDRISFLKTDRLTFLFATTLPKYLLIPFSSSAVCFSIKLSPISWENKVKSSKNHYKAESISALCDLANIRI